MSNRALLTVTLVAFMPVALIFFLWALSGDPSTFHANKKPVPVAKVIFIPPHVESPAGLQMISTSPVPALVLRPAAFPSDKDPNSVQDADLKGLASMVKLASAKQGAPDKAKWSQALPIAKKLAAGTCDCEQRNWLNQFITMGNYALSGSSQYYDLAKLMDTLPLNDTDVATRYYSN